MGCELVVHNMQGLLRDCICNIKNARNTLVIERITGILI